MANFSLNTFIFMFRGEQEMNMYRLCPFVFSFNMQNDSLKYALGVSFHRLEIGDLKMLSTFLAQDRITHQGKSGF